MRLFTVLSSLLLLTSPALARKAKPKPPSMTTTTPAPPPPPAATTGCGPTPGDATVVKFAYALEDLNAQFYRSTPLNSTAFTGAPNETTALWAPNFTGMQKQSNLSLTAIQQLGSMTPNFTAPACNFTLPHTTSPRVTVETAYYLESSISGAFIGLAGYSQSPEVAFLMARLAAVHEGHAVYIQSNLREPVFSDANNTLVPAYPPEHVLTSGMAPGMLGSFLGSCVKAPDKPCGNTLIVDGTSGNLTDNTSIIASALATQTAS